MKRHMKYYDYETAEKMAEVIKAMVNRPKEPSKSISMAFKRAITEALKEHDPRCLDWFTVKADYNIANGECE